MRRGGREGGRRYCESERILTSEYYKYIVDI